MVAPLARSTSAQIAAGAVIPFALDETIDSESSPKGGMFSGTVSADVQGTDGKLAIPMGAAGVVLVVDASKKDGISNLSVLLYQVTVNSESRVLGHAQSQMARLDYHEEAAKGSAHRSVHLQRGDVLRFPLKDSFRLN